MDGPMVASKQKRWTPSYFMLGRSSKIAVSVFNVIVAFVFILIYVR